MLAARREASLDCKGNASTSTPASSFVRIVPAVVDPKVIRRRSLFDCNVPQLRHHGVGRGAMDKTKPPPDHTHAQSWGEALPQKAWAPTHAHTHTTFAKHSHTWAGDPADAGLEGGGRPDRVPVLSVATTALGSPRSHLHRRHKLRPRGCSQARNEGDPTRVQGKALPNKRCWSPAPSCLRADVAQMRDPHHGNWALRCISHGNASKRSGTPWGGDHRMAVHLGPERRGAQHVDPELRQGMRKIPAQSQRRCARLEDRRISHPCNVAGRRDHRPAPTDLPPRLATTIPCFQNNRCKPTLNGG